MNELKSRSQELKELVIDDLKSILKNVPIDKYDATRKQLAAFAEHFVCMLEAKKAVTKA